MRNAQAEAQLLHDLGVDVGLKVQVKIGIWKGTMPAIERDSIITVSAGVNASPGLGGKTYYEIKRTGTVTSKDGFFHGTEVTKKGGRKGSYKVKEVDEAGFERALMEMYPPFMGMAIALIDQD